MTLREMYNTFCLSWDCSITVPSLLHCDTHLFAFVLTVNTCSCVTFRVLSRCHKRVSSPVFMPTNNVQALLAQDISDPTDFSATNLRQLDASFRCTICGEFFDAPITLACGHCFCSLVRDDASSAL